MKYKVKFTEILPDGTFHKSERTCSTLNKKQIIDFYGLDHPDILDYSIEEINE